MKPMGSPIRPASAPTKSFRFSLSELSGALADLGVMLPLLLALIRLNGLNATASFVGVGLAYLLTAFVYQLPIPVQPLKSVSALAIALGLPPVIIVSGAIWNAVAFLGMGLTGADRWVRKAFPPPVVRGIQLGLAYLLIRSAWKLAFGLHPGWEGGFNLGGWRLDWATVLVGGSLLLLLLLQRRKPGWAALSLVLFGVGVSGLHLGLPPLSLRLHLPPMWPFTPDGDQLLQGLWLLAVPQIPLSLGNSIYATADAARQYFGKRAQAVSERRLMLTMGVNDAIAATLGGLPVCHGSGGLTAHVRLGARSGGAPLMLGLGFLGLGLFAGESSMRVFGLIPFPVLGVLLAYVGVQHALLARDLRGAWALSTAGLVLILTILTGNLGVGFISGSVFHAVWSWISERMMT